MTRKEFIGPFANIALVADDTYAVIVDHRRVVFGPELYCLEEMEYLNKAVAARDRATAATARSSRKNVEASGWRVGPVVRLEVPAPEKKKEKK